MSIAKILARSCKPALFLTLLLLIVAVGCGPAPTEFVVITETSSPVPATATIQPQLTETPVPVATLPLPTATSFAPRAVIKIAANVPLSGDRADFGQDIANGATLAVQQLSGPLNELSYQVELATYDDQNLAETALKNAQKLVADPDILCGLGNYDSDITIAASDIYHQAALPFISPAATAPQLTDRSFLEANRLIGRTDGQGVAAANFAKDKGFTNVFIVSDKSEISLRNSDSFRVESGRLGIQRVGSVIAKLTAENTDNVVSQVVKANPDLVYISYAAGQGIPFLTELRAAGYKGAVLGTDLLNSRSLITEAGPSLVKGGDLFYTIMNPPAEYYSDAAQFNQDFANQFGTAPLSYAARAYDATGMCLKAIAEASKAKGGTLPTRGEVAKAIRDLKDYKGITGTYTFNTHGDPDPVQYYIYQVVSTDATNWNQNPVVASYEITPP